MLAEANLRPEIVPAELRLEAGDPVAGAGGASDETDGCRNEPCLESMEIVTPLGDDVLLFHGMHAREEMSRLFEYQLDLLSAKNDINLDDILGKNVTVKLALPDDSTRYFNGYVTRFRAGRHATAAITATSPTVRPWLWFLTRTADCRIFQEMTVPDIIKKVFGDQPTADFKLELTGTYRKWTYCVQYRETDFNFVSRLMEEEGIYYYFRHTDGHNTLVLTDSTSKHTPAPGYETIPFIAPEQVVRPELEHISSWDFAREIQPGVYVHDDYDLERPSVELQDAEGAVARATRRATTRSTTTRATTCRRPTASSMRRCASTSSAASSRPRRRRPTPRASRVGSLFTLEDCPREDQNREHLILAASYDLEFSDYEAMPEGAGTSYRCSFVAMSSEQQFRPKRPTPKPFVQGPQTAVVVGPGGDEIYTDKYGRVKVQFHWDRLRQEGREQLVLDPRVASVGGQGLGRGLDAAHRPGGDRRFPRRRSRSADHHRPGLQRREPAAVRVPGRRGAERHQVEHAQGRRATTSCRWTTRPGRSRSSSTASTTWTPSSSTTRRRRSTTTGPTWSTSTTRKRWAATRRSTSSRTRPSTSTSSGRRPSAATRRSRSPGTGRETVNGGEDVTVNGCAHAHRQRRADDDDLAGGGAHRRRPRGRTPSARLRRSPSARRRWSASARFRAITVGASQSTNVGAAQSTTVGAARSVTVGAAQTTKIAAALSTSVGADESHSVTGGRTHECRQGRRDQGRQELLSSMRAIRSCSRPATPASR